MLDFVWFMLFSTIEGLAVYALILYIFRFKLEKFIMPSLAIITLMNLQSFFIREDTSLGYLVPVINLFSAILFMKYVVSIPIVGAIFSSILGYISFSLIQILFTYLMFGSISVIGEAPLNGYMLQLLTGLSGITIGYILYKLGIGFTSDFNKFSFKYEKGLILTLSMVFGAVLASILFLGDLYLVLVFFVISMVGFTYYAVRKETE